MPRNEWIIQHKMVCGWADEPGLFPATLAGRLQEAGYQVETIRAGDALWRIIAMDDRQLIKASIVAGVRPLQFAFHDHQAWYNKVTKSDRSPESYVREQERGEGVRAIQMDRLRWSLVVPEEGHDIKHEIEFLPATPDLLQEIEQYRFPTL